MTQRKGWRVGLGVALAAAMTTGCASTHMKQFIGKDVRLVALHDGPPVNVLDLPDGTRAFQYLFGGGTVTLPTTTTTTGQAQVVGTVAYYSEQKLESGGATITSPGCIVSYIARWVDEVKGWIVTGIVYPKQLVC